jgi:alanine-glyoxylate transaminase/serine-glyoxylate transaminase/serine-pyruvate transaminase
LFGLNEAIKMLREEGREMNRPARRHSAATRAAAKVWGLETNAGSAALRR